MKALSVENTLRNAIKEQKDFRNSADSFKHLADKYIIDEEKRDEFLNEMADIFRSFKSAP